MPQKTGNPPLRPSGRIALHRLGPVDGLFGPQTAVTIRRFQQAIGVKPTGVITADGVSRLVSTPAPVMSR